jgi:WhiB family redox-sensing transcriptional regulator
MRRKMFDTTDAKCVGEPIDTFYELNRENEIRAKTLCNSCPIVEQCLTWAVFHKEEYGIWGGKNPEELRILRDRVRRTSNNKTMVIKLALQPKKKK